MDVGGEEGTFQLLKSFAKKEKRATIPKIDILFDLLRLHC